VGKKNQGRKDSFVGWRHFGDSRAANFPYSIREIGGQSYLKLESNHYYLGSNSGMPLKADMNGGRLKRDLHVFMGLDRGGDTQGKV